MSVGAILLIAVLLLLLGHFRDGRIAETGAMPQAAS